MWTEFQSAPPPRSLTWPDHYAAHLRLVASQRTAFGPQLWHFKYTVANWWTDFLRVRLPLGPATDGLTALLNAEAIQLGLGGIIPRTWEPVAAFLDTNASLTPQQIDALLVIWRRWSNAIMEVVARNASDPQIVIGRFAIEAKSYFQTGNIACFAGEAEKLGWPSNAVKAFDVLVRQAGFFLHGPVHEAGTHLLANSVNLPYL